MTTIHLLNHPLLNHKLARLRDKTTNAAEFRNLINEISRFLVYEASRDLATKTQSVQTPLALSTVEVIENIPAVVSIMRAGNGMMEAINTTIPDIHSGHFGIYREKLTGNTVEYYLKLPKDIKSKTVFVVDPMIGTGDTMMAAVKRLKKMGIETIKCLVILASKHGIQKLTNAYPDIQIYTLSADEELDENSYLVPGIGDVGDRYYNTK